MHKQIFDLASTVSVSTIRSASICCRYATKLLAAGGILALTRALTSKEQIPRSVRYVLAAVEALMLSCPAAACEALLGWWNPTSEENQTRIREAQEQEEYYSEVEQENGDLDAEEYEVEKFLIVFAELLLTSLQLLKVLHLECPHG